LTTKELSNKFKVKFPPGPLILIQSLQIVKSAADNRSFEKQDFRGITWVTNIKKRR